MDGTSALITLGLLFAAFGLAGVACYFIERAAKKKEADWTGENSMRAQR